MKRSIARDHSHCINTPNPLKLEKHLQPPYLPSVFHIFLHLMPQFLQLPNLPVTFRIILHQTS